MEAGTDYLSAQFQCLLLDCSMQNPAVVLTMILLGIDEEPDLPSRV